MNQIYLQLREEARNIVANLPAPKFYQQFSQEISYSRQMLQSHPLLIRIRKEINPIVEDDFGHGMHHSDLVCVDAGAIIQIEMQRSTDRIIADSKAEEEGESSIISRSSTQIEEKQPGTTVISREITNKILLVQVAGLLHDIKRKEKKHSTKGAKFAQLLLSTGGYPLTADEISTICNAISEHEAFQKEKRVHRETHDYNKRDDRRREEHHGSSLIFQSLISKALYDADKFRWGPDNFTHTLWDMVIFSNTPLPEFVRRYPDGMKILEQIKDTFRTDTGKKYGPDFIDLGLEAGNRLFKMIRTLNTITGQ